MGLGLQLHFLDHQVHSANITGLLLCTRVFLHEGPNSHSKPFPKAAITKSYRIAALTMETGEQVPSEDGGEVAVPGLAAYHIDGRLHVLIASSLWGWISMFPPPHKDISPVGLKPLSMASF
jgi:hypothetical protein